MTTKELIERIKEHLSQGDLDLIKRVCDFAEEHYAHIVHPIGKPYIQYAYEVALRLVDLHADLIAVAAVIISPPLSIVEQVLNDLKQCFRSEKELVALVEELLYLGQLEWDAWPATQEQKEKKEYRERQEILHKMFLLAIGETKSEAQEGISSTVAHFQKQEKQAENLIRMFFAAVADVRTLIIKLVDRLLFTKLLKDLSQPQRESLHYIQYAKITLATYAPLADRLGMWRLKSELEDMSFRLLDPGKYMAIAKQLQVKKQDRENYLDHTIIPALRKKLEELGIKAQISGRAKHIYSIYQKMEAKQLTFEQINDLLGVRIIVETSGDCYMVQGILHENWPPVTSVYDGKAGRDWIAHPKENLYQSLHTTIRMENRNVEVQIRTGAMHEVAEHGIAAAHWQYKQSKAYRKGKTLKVAGAKDQSWSKQLAELQKSLAYGQLSGPQMQKDLLKYRIFVITPEGHIIGLAAGATPLDFAYRIHTERGHGYAGAKVGNHLVRPDYELKSGEIIELLPVRTRKGPNPDWLSKNRLDDELKTRLDNELKSKLDDEFKKGDPVEPIALAMHEGLLPQWLHMRGKGNESKTEEDYMYYIFARTRQARSKIRKWLNEQNDTQKPKWQK